MISPIPRDPFGRAIDYLRISITDQCNERCLYCRPAGYRGWTAGPEHLTAKEIIQVARAACQLGFRHFRLTGGEPLLRPDLLEITSGLAALEGVETLSLSTNGTRIAAWATALRQAGIQSVNLSIDALQPERYRQITGGCFAEFLDGFQAVLRAGFETIKLNCVLLRGMNEEELRPLTRFAAEHNVPIRFIELMPLSLLPEARQNLFFSVAEAREIIGAGQTLVPLADHRPGHGPARYFRDSGSGAVVGFIGAMTTPDFCSSCNKMRLTADGKIRPCLGRHGEINLREALRSGAAGAGELLEQALANKPQDHEFTRGYEPSRPMTALGG
ncbi:MAG: GTP 3',8-cyclase MoaA [Candidatus Methylacidiphilales bacterium]